MDMDTSSAGSAKSEGYFCISAPSAPSVHTPRLGTLKPWRATGDVPLNDEVRLLGSINLISLVLQRSIVLAYSKPEQNEAARRVGSSLAALRRCRVVAYAGVGGWGGRYP